MKKIIMLTVIVFNTLLVFGQINFDNLEMEHCVKINRISANGNEDEYYEEMRNEEKDMLRYETNFFKPYYDYYIERVVEEGTEKSKIKFTYDALFEKNNVKGHKTKWGYYTTSFYSEHERWRDAAWPIGTYSFSVYYCGNVYAFELKDYQKEENYNKLCEDLEKAGYIFSDFGLYIVGVLEGPVGYYWEDDKYEEFVKDLEEKNPKLPETCIKFREEYEDLIQKVLAIVDEDAAKNMRYATDNLRIRDKPNLKKGTPLITVNAGTGLRILEKGKKAKIDEIKGNWMKVLVPAGSFDKDGNIVEEEIEGWCFDGYLSS